MSAMDRQTYELDSPMNRRKLDNMVTFPMHNNATLLNTTQWDPTNMTIWLPPKNQNSTIQLNLKPPFQGAFLERFRRRFCLRGTRANQALLLKKNASTMDILMFPWTQFPALINVRAEKICYPKRYLSACRRVKLVEIAILVGC